MATTKEQIIEALRRMDEDGVTAYRAATDIGIPAPTVQAAYNRRKLRRLEAAAAGCCTACGAPTNKKGRYMPPV